jgi:hypothetical protein
MAQPLASIPNTLVVLMAIAKKVPPNHVEFLGHFHADYDNLKREGEAAVHLTVNRFLKGRCKARTTTIQQLYDVLVACEIGDAAQYLLSVASSSIIHDPEQIDSIVQQVGGLHRSIIATITTETVV